MSERKAANSKIQLARDKLIKEKEELKKEREREHSIAHNMRTDSTLYATKQWRQLRNYYLMNNPCCEIHLRHGIVRAAEAVHHKRPFLLGKTLDEQKSLCYSEDNLMSVCKSCHQQLHAELNWHDGQLDDCTPYELIEW